MKATSKVDSLQPEKSINISLANEIKANEKYSIEVCDNGGLLERPLTLKQNPNEEENNYKTYKALANTGKKYRLLPVVNIKHVKNPDAKNLETGHFSDAKHPTTANGRSVIERSVSSAYKQDVDEIVIRLSKTYPRKEIQLGIYNTLTDKQYYNIKTLIIIYVDFTIREIDADKFREAIKTTKGKPVS